MEDLHLIVGLGNPGAEYAKTRHNAGFMLVELLAMRWRADWKNQKKFQSRIAKTERDGKRLVLSEPQTFMNLSGEAVNCFLKKPERSVERMLVISDDLALPFGKIRLRPSGSHGGHNGLRSIIDCLGTNEFARLRIGITPEHPVTNTKGFVLENFSKAESGELETLLKTCAEAVRSVIKDGIDRAMAEFN